MHIREFEFDLPPDLVAQEPPRQRDAARLMYLPREGGQIRHLRILDLPRLLQPGDLLVGYTDGITEPENSYGEEFGEQRLFSLLEDLGHLAPAEIIAGVMAAVREWTASPEQPDDMTLVVLKVGA